MRTSIMWKALALAGVLAATSAAAPGAPISHAANEPGIHTTVGLTVDWQHSSPRGIAALRARGITPDNTVSGPCGTATMSAQNNGMGEATFVNSAHSTLGAIDTFDLTDSWLNHNTNDNNTVSKSGVGNGSNFLQPLRTYTGSGIVSVVMSYLRVILYDGTVCTGLDPSDAVDVT